VPRACACACEGEDGLRWPQGFLKLKEEQRAGARVMLGQVHSGLRQAVLDEWDARCREGRIRHPAAYLYGVVQKALRREFKVWAGQSAEQNIVPPHPSGTDDQAAVAPPVRSEAAREHLSRLRAMLRGAPYLPGPP
jgi:hypothetical protein